MTKNELRKCLNDAGMKDEMVNRLEDRFDVEEISRLVDEANTQDQAFEAIHRLYPELKVEALKKQCDFYREEFEKTFKEDRGQNKVELSDDELANIAGGSFFSSIGNWFQDNWKAVAIGAAVVVGVALICTGVGAAIGSAITTSSLAFGPATADLAFTYVMTTTACTGTGALIGAGVGAVLGGATAGALGATGVIGNVADNL